MAVVRVTPSGVMDKDTDMAYVSQGNYVDANDIRHRQTDGSTFGGVMSVAGNKELLNIPGYGSSTKTFRIYIDLTNIANGSVGGNDGDLYLEDSSGTVYSNTGLNLTGTVIATYVATLKTYFNVLSNAAYGGLFTYSATTITGTYTAYFDLSTGLDTDYVLRVNNGSSALCDIRLKSEYYSTGGNFKVIGSQQLQDYLFVWLASDVVSTGITSEVSEIGVIYTNDGGGTYNYQRLLRSKKMGFSTQRRIEAEIERNGDEVNLYWTDGYNKPRAMYLKYSLITTQDAFIFIGGGRYELETIDDESSLFYKVSSAYLDDVEVVEGAGALSVGNKRYTGRFLTEDFVPTDFLYPTNPINIYSALTAKPYKILGDIIGSTTNKAVNLTVKNITPGVYKYFELIAIEYVDETFSTKVVQRFSIDTDATELSVKHTNIGQENILLSNSELVAITSRYLTTQSLKVFDNRLTLSNLTEQVDYNLEAWAQAIEHSLETEQITALGNIADSDMRKNDLQYRLGEYINPNNTLSFTSYMMNDTYRFGIQVQWKNTGKWSAPYWVDDIRFDTLATNVIGTRRIANNIDSNLTDVNTNNVNIYYVKFHNINLDYLVGGYYLRDLISSFRFVRAERIPEVLATGYFIPGCNFSGEPTYVYPYYRQYRRPTGVLEQFPNYFTGGATQIANTDKSEFLYFYSPDQKLSQFNYSFTNNDELRILGVPKTNLTLTEQSIDASASFVEYNGHFVSSATPYLRIATSGTSITLDDYTPANIGELKAFSTAANLFNGAQDVSRNLQTYNDNCHVFKLSAKLRNVGTPNFSGLYPETAGIYYGQIFRNLGANKKYPINKELTQYQNIGDVYRLGNGENGIINNHSVFGGDIFNQKFHYQLRWGASTSQEWGALISIYSQNVTNAQMMYALEDDGTSSGAGYLFPQYLDASAPIINFTGPTTAASTANAGTIGAGLFDVLHQNLNNSNQYNYSKAYNYTDNTILETGYDSNVTYDGSLPSRITWSAKKVIGSQKDNYRIFKPLDFADLDLTLGPIVHHDIINAALYTWQPYSVQRQYFREASLLGAQEGTDIVVGSGSILGSPGTELTTIGADYKWNVVKGNTPNGKESCYWFNARLKKFVRFGQDGNRVISDKGLISFLQNNTRFLEYYGYPLTGKGIHGVWNDKYAEAIFSFKALNPSIPSWEVTTYAAGDYVLISPLTTYVHASGLPYAYKCKLNHTASASTKPETGANWQTYWTKVTPGTDSFAHTLFTIVYDEIKNGFITFHSYWPDIYLRYKNTFWSPNPLAPEEMYLHDAGLESEYYDTYYSPTITAVMNYDPNVSKNFEALQMVTDQQPFFVDLTTPNHISYLDETEFEEREDLWYSPIKNNSAVTGLNNGDTSRLWGKWLKVKLSLEASIGKQKLINFMVKFRPMARLYNQ